MKKVLKKWKKLIFAGIALALVVGVVAVDFGTKATEVYAEQNIFQPVSTYSELNVLEIVPSKDSAEIGYFIPTPTSHNEVQAALDGYTGGDASWDSANGHKLLWTASYGLRYGKDTEGSNDASYINLLLQMRKYGLIKYVGLDSPTTAGVSEYPIYTVNWATFTDTTAENGYAPLPSTSNSDYVYGHYVYHAGESSYTYELDDGYIIGTGTNPEGTDDNGNPKPLYDESLNEITSGVLDSNYIYKVNKDTVSGNGVSYTSYQKIPSGLGVPAGVSYVGSGGNVEFITETNSEDIYQGYSVSQYLYRTNREPSQGFFLNGKWFKEYILGNANSDVAVNYDVVEANAVTVDQIKNADLVYISGQSSEFISASQDLSEAVVMQLYNQTTQGNPDRSNRRTAIMMDYLAYSGSELPVNNIDKLALLTWQENQTAIPADYTGGFDSTGVMTNATTALNNAEMFQRLRTNMKSGYQGNLAINNIYIYNHHWQDFQDSLLKNQQVDALDNFANGDLKSAYSALAATEGFSSVLAYIKINNNITTIGHVAEGVVTPALAIQYILSYNGEDLGMVKSQYSVLEIQPTKQFLYNDYNESVAYGFCSAEVQKNRDNFIQYMIGEGIVTNKNQEYISFTSMTIDEYNTRQMDVFSDYDIVYIGDEWSEYYKTATCSTMAVNDTTMTQAAIPVATENSLLSGRIYYNLGDATGENGSTVTYSSRDLTKVKLKELKNYLDQGGLIVVGEELMASKGKGNKVINPTQVAATSGSEGKVDNGRVDTSSNLYELLSYGVGKSYDADSVAYTAVTGTDAVGAKSNLVSESDVKNGYVTQMDLSSYLGRSILQLSLQDEPVSYVNYVDADGVSSTLVRYLDAEDDGKYYLRYDFSISNSEVDAALGQTYTLHFYQDQNADGVFSDTEELTDITITNGTGSTEADSVTTNGVTVYTLYGGTAYELVREVPSDEGGIIHWAIKVEKSTDANVYTMETGYTAIRPMNRRVLNILQITDNDDTTINLENLDSDSLIKKYLNNSVVVEQYDINIRTITIKEFASDLADYLSSTSASGFSTTEARYLKYFDTFQRDDDDASMKVNMLILGFGNSMEGFSADQLGAIRAYINSGRPLLTSNSVVTDSVNTSLAYYLGTDRYGYSNPLYASVNKTVSYSISDAEDKTTFTNYAIRREKAGNAVGYTIANSLDLARRTTSPIPLALTNTVIREKSGTTTGSNYINSSVVNNFTKTSHSIADSYMFVDNMNDGQITTYPYTLDSHVLISTTRAQALQADLDSDDNHDNKSDVVVWYTLSTTASASNSSYDDEKSRIATGDVYYETPGDGINNYYIYNNGNVTFTGLGASKSCTVSEAQLFVNTLIAAFEAGFSDPLVNFYQTADVNDGKLESIAVAYDANVTAKNDVQSSIQYDTATQKYLYKFVNPNTNSSTTADGTKAFFKITDTNLVKGDKVVDVAFYLGVSGKKGDRISIKDGSNTYTYEIEEITLNDNTVVTVVRIPIDIYTTDFTKVGTSSAATSKNGTNPQLEVGTMYGFYAPMSYLETMGSAKIYLQANTGYKSLDSNGSDTVIPLGTSYDMFTLIKQDLLKLD